MYILEVFDGHLDLAFALLVCAARGGQRPVERLGAPARLLDLALCCLHARPRRVQLSVCASTSPITLLYTHTSGACTLLRVRCVLLKCCCYSLVIN